MIQDAVDGNNTDGELLLFANERLKVRPERRKVMLVLSDGVPCAYTSYEGALKAHLHTAIKEITSQGTMVAGIGIQSREVRDYFKHHVVVSDVASLSGVAMTELAKILLGKDARKLTKAA
jgi:cobalamin biosynthesis protein CobT